MGLDGKYIASIYYNMVVDQPFYFDYAIGYCQLAQLYRGTKNELGDKFDLPLFLKTYLDLSAGSFDLIRKIGVWSDSLLDDVA